MGLLTRVGDFLWKNRIRIEIAFYSTLGAILGYTLGVADVPSIIPPSQASFIGWLAPFLIVMSPSLVCSAILGSLSQFFVIVHALACVTTLLVISAKGGDGAVTAGFAGVALWISGLRFFPSTGFKVSIDVINITLTVLAFYEVVQNPGGIEFIKMLWTESGTENPMAYMQQVLIAWGWIMFISIVPLILPPWRTARESIVRDFLPVVFEHNIRFLRGGMGNVGGEVGMEDGEDPSLREKEEEKLVYALFRDVVSLTDGKLATLTAFEPVPRMFRPVASWVILKEVLLTLREFTLQNLAAVKFFKGEVAEEGVIETLQDCSDIMKGSVRGSFPGGVEMKEFGGWEGESDPFLLKRKAQKVRDAVEKWTHAMGGCCSSVPEDVNMGYPTTMKMTLVPWLLAWLGFYKILFFDIPFYILTPTCYRRLFDWRGNTDWVKAVWYIKFTVGMTCCFIMQVYWPAYANFAVPTDDAPGDNFAGWETIAFVMAFTQTTEGTLKKGTLRALGTCVGTFSGWLALTACTSTGSNGEDDINPSGVVAWLSVTYFIVTLFPFENGPRARLGMNPDYGYGVQLYILTQSIVVLYAFNGAGTKDDLVANRIVANLVGIAMAVVIALIPPQNLAGNPRNGRVIADLQQKKILKIIHFVKELGDDPERDPTERLKELERENGKIEEEIHGLFDETNDFIKDASRLSRFPVFKLDPQLKPIMGSLMITNAVIDVMCRDIFRHLSLPENAQQRAVYAPGTEMRGQLEEMERRFLEGDTEGVGERKPELGVQMLVSYLEYLLRKAGHQREVLSQIRYGIFSMNYC